MDTIRGNHQPLSSKLIFLSCRQLLLFHFFLALNRSSLFIPCELILTFYNAQNKCYKNYAINNGNGNHQMKD